MFFEIVSKGKLPAYTDRQWMWMTRGRDIKIFQPDEIPEGGLYHKHVDRVFIIADTSGNLLSVLFIEPVSYVLETEKIFLLDKTIADSMSMIFTQDAEKESGYCTYICGMGLVWLGEFLAFDEVSKFLCLSELNSDVIKSVVMPQLSPMCGSFQEIASLGIDLKGFSGDLLPIIGTVVHMLNAAGELVEKSGKILPPRISSEGREESLRLGDWGLTIQTLSINLRSVYNKTGCFWFWDSAEKAYCLIGISKGSIVVAKLEGINGVKSKAFAEHSSIELELMKDWYYSVINARVPSSISIYSIDWSVLYEWEDKYAETLRSKRNLFRINPI